MALDEKRKRVGRLGEDIASQFLERKGYTVIERNFRRPWGEIDVIAEKDGIVHFVEVKAVSREINPASKDISREKFDYLPEEQIHPTKLRKICQTAELYMANYNAETEYQIDAVAVLLNEKTRQASCRLYEQIL